MGSFSSRHRRARALAAAFMSVVAVGSFIAAVTVSTAVVASAAPGDFTIPAGGTATITSAGFAACDPLTYGYVLNGAPVVVDSKSSGCEPLTPAAGVSIGPVAANSTLTIYLTDFFSDDTFASDGNHALVSGTNPYTVDISDDGVGSCSNSCTRVPAEGQGNLTLTLTITPPLVTISPAAALSGTEGAPLATSTVATFSDTNTAALAAEFSASINWGDGHSSAGTISGGSGSFTVAGSNTYAEEGSYEVSVSVTDSVGGAVYTTTTSAAVADAPLTGGSVVVPPATTGVGFTTTVATFTDANKEASSSDFAAAVSWGDGTTSSGLVSGSAGSYAVSGSHTYALHGTTASPVSVLITDHGGSTVTVVDNLVTVADGVITCTGGSCSGTLTTPAISVQATTTASGPGVILLTSDPNSGSTGLNCGDPFRHAPRIVTESDTLVPGSSTITITQSFPAKSGTVGSGIGRLVFWICFQAKHPFKDLAGQMTTLGLLPVCNPFRADPGPCVNWILPGPSGTIVERLTYPIGDPRFG